MNELSQSVSEPALEGNLSPKSVHHWCDVDTAASVLEGRLDSRHSSASKWTVLVWQIQGFPLSECFLQLLKGLLDASASSAPASRGARDLLCNRNVTA